MAFLKSIGTQAARKNGFCRSEAVGNCASPVVVVIAPNCLALFGMAFFWPVQMVVRLMGEAIGDTYNLLDEALSNHPTATTRFVILASASKPTEVRTTNLNETRLRF